MMLMRYAFFLLVVGILLTGCTQSAEPSEEDDCLDPNFRAPVEVTLNVEDVFLPYAEVDSTRYHSTETVDSVFTRGRKRADECWRLRYYLAAYRRNESEPTEYVTSLEPKITLMLSPDKYEFVGWVDRVPENGKSHYFYTDDFSELLMKHKYEYVADNPFKVPYRGASFQSVAYTTTSTTVDCTPAMAKYRLVATDSLSFQPGRVQITYLGALPSSVNGRTGHINYYWSDMYYDSKIERQDSVHEIAKDYVLSHSDGETNVVVRVEIFDDQDNIRARCSQLVIPLRNAGVTTIRGNFFSMQDFDTPPSTLMGGGIMIDPDFDGTVEIEL